MNNDTGADQHGTKQVYGQPLLSDLGDLRTKTLTGAGAIDAGDNGSVN